MGKSLNRKGSGSNLFTKEILGMALILFSVLSFLCLFIGDVIYPVGAIVRGFLLGTLGYYSLVFLLGLIMFGVRLVVAKPLFSRSTSLLLFVASVLVFASFGICHTAMHFNQTMTLNERVTQTFANGVVDFSNATMGGALIAGLSQILVNSFQKVGAYIIYSLVLFMCLVYFLNKFLFGKSFAKKQPQVPQDQQTPQPQTFSQPFASAPQNFGQQTAQTPSAQQQEQPTAVNQQPFVGAPIGMGETQVEQLGLYIYGSNPYENGTAHETAQTYSSPISYAFGANSELYTQTKSAQPKTYTSDYEDDFSRKLKLVTTPAPVNLENIGQTPFGERNPNAGSAIHHETKQNPYGGETKDVYSSRTAQSTTVAPIDSFDRARSQSQSIGEYGARSGTETISSVAQNGVGPQTFDRTVAGRMGGAEIPRDNAGTPVEDMFAPPKGRFVDETPVTQQDVTRRAYNPLQNDMGGTNLGGATTPSRVVETPSRVVETPSRVVETPSRVVETPSRVVETPSRVVETPSRVVETPSRVVETPSRTATTVVPPVDNQPVEEKPNPIDLMPVNYRYKAPPLALLKDYSKDEVAIQENKRKQQERADLIVRLIRNFSRIEATVEDIVCGPTVTRFVISIPEDASVKGIRQMQDELTQKLAAKSDIRMLIPIPGTNLIGIEVPNETKTVVGLKEILSSREYRALDANSVSFALGKSVIGEPIFLDFTRMPHLLVAGSTGTGKSVCLNAMLVSLLYRYSPEDLRLVIVDPKMVEFEFFKGIPHLMFSEIIGLDGKVLPMFKWATNEMNRRYDLFKKCRVKDIKTYNNNVAGTEVEGLGMQKKLPYLIILVDEFAELLITSNEKKNLEIAMQSLAQKSRAAGISLVFATQRPSADVIDGSIKTNFVSRICFKTSSHVDSNVVLGQTGAEMLVGKGDTLYRTQDVSIPERAQGALITDDEIIAVCNYIRDHNKCYYDEKVWELISNEAKEKQEEEQPRPKQVSGLERACGEVDEAFLRVLRIVITTRKATKTAVQSKMSIGFSKLSRAFAWMESEGFVGPQIDTKQRDIYITKEQYIERFKDWPDDGF